MLGVNRDIVWRSVNAPTQASSATPISKNLQEDAVNKLDVYLSFGLRGLLLSGAASAQSHTSRSDQDRADALLKQMTTEEKIGQMNQPFYLKLPIPGVEA